MRGERRSAEPAVIDADRDDAAPVDQSASAREHPLCMPGGDSPVGGFRLHPVGSQRGSDAEARRAEAEGHVGREAGD